MDFIDEPPFASFSSSPIEDDYFARQALRVGYMMRPGVVERGDDREIEKQRIRHEIIVAENLRRRQLEAEVRMELTRKRELALLRTRTGPPPHQDRYAIPFEERLPFSRGSQVFQPPANSSTSGSEHRRVVLLPKPVIGTKRKVETAGSSDLSVAGSKENPQSKLVCDLCQVTATSEQALEEHLQGKKHKKKTLRQETTILK